jgi:hypothetical protein
MTDPIALERFVTARWSLHSSWAGRRCGSTPTTRRGRWLVRRWSASIFLIRSWPR